MADIANKFITADSDSPFFLIMSYVDPHAPYPAQVDGLPETPFHPGQIQPWPIQQVADEATRKNATNYYNAVRRLDAGIGLQQAMTRAANPPEWEFHDLQTDPGEFQNLADDPAHAGTLKRMQRLLHEWRKETAAPFLDPSLLAKRHRDVNPASHALDSEALSKKK